MEVFFLIIFSFAVLLFFYLQKHEHDRAKVNALSENKSKFFTKEHYDLLSYNLTEIKNLADELNSDKSFSDYFIGIASQNISNLEKEELIKYLIIFDAGKIACRIRPELPVNSIEMFALALLVLKLNEIRDEVNWDYSYSKTSFCEYFRDESSAYGKVCEEIMAIIKGKNKVQVIASRNEDSWDIDLDFSLPVILKYLDSSLADKYSSTLYRFATILVKSDAVVTREEEIMLIQIYQGLNTPISEEKINSLKGYSNDPDDSLESVICELDNLIGLEEVKREVKTLVNFINIQREREKQRLKISPISYHCVFTGPPGTGKTTVARIIGRIYKQLGILSKGHLIEADRASLIGEYVGQTAPKVDKLVTSALDGVLFIDEAYSVMNSIDDPYGKEAVSALIKRIEDNRDRLIVIMAGYPEEMHEFIDSNPGFRSRFNRYIDFKDYSPMELLEIFEKFCKSSDYALSEPASKKILKLFEEHYKNRVKSFGNARLARNLFEETLENQANRISILNEISKEVLLTLEEDDIPG